MKTYLVVGSTRGIGECVTRKLIGKQNKVICLSSKKTDSHIHSDLLTYHQIDITQDNLSIPSIGNTLDGLVYCPGSINLKSFPSLTNEEFIHDFQINVLGLINTLQYCLPALKSTQNASVVAFSTVAVQQGISYHASIATAKGALEGLMRSLAAEYASTNIRFNAIAPSIVDTSLSKQLLNNDDKKTRLSKRHPLNKIGDPDEIAELVSFLLSDASKWMTGQVIHSDGGLSSIIKF